jgi:hypothetical protein
VCESRAAEWGALGDRTGGAAAVAAAGQGQDPVHAAVGLDHDPARAEERGYVDRKYHEVEDAIQEGMDALARKRALPLFA